MFSPLLHRLYLGFLICLGLVDAPAGRPRVSMGGFDDDAPDRAVELWKGSQMISRFNGSLQIDPPYKNTLQFDADTGVYSINYPRVEDSGHYTYNTTSNSSEYIVHIFGPGMENQSIPLGPFNESTMRAKVFESMKSGPFIRVASYHKGLMSNDQTVSLKVINGSLKLEIHTAADRVFRLDIMGERDSVPYLIANVTLIIAPAYEDPAIPADNRTLNETTERNTTKRYNEDQTNTWGWYGLITVAVLIPALILALILAFRPALISALVVFGVSRVRHVHGAMGNFKDRILGLMPFTDWCKNEGPVHDSAKEGDLNVNAEVQRDALSCNLERVTVQPGNAREEVPLLGNTQSLGTDQV